MSQRNASSTPAESKASAPLSASTTDSHRQPDAVASNPERIPLELPEMPAATSPWLAAVERQAAVTGHALPTSLRGLLQDRRFAKVIKGPARGTMLYREYFTIDAEMLARVLLDEETS